jgi:signal transduction histidine kinase
VHRRAGVERTFELRNAEPWSEIPERVAKTLGRIGEEALMNAELHSGCAREHVVLDLGRDHVELTVADDGRGLGAGAGDDAAAPEPGHFGIRGMRAAAVEAGGQLTIEPGAEGGLLVRARIPTAPPGSPG